MVSANSIVKKRVFLIEHTDWMLGLLAYHKAWANKIRTSDSVVLWNWGDKESSAEIDAIT